MSERDPGVPSPVEQAARLLRQSAELAGPDLVLESLTAAHALELARAARAGRASGARPPAGGGAESAPSARRGAEPPARAGARAPRTAAAPAPAAGACGDAPKALPALPASYEELREAALACTRCRLAQGRTHVVFSDGVVDARVVVVGEAPGANEDETGLPFVGAAGKFLDLLLATVGLSRRESVYICNVLKCRPPGNRNPLPDEIAACAPFLERQLELVKPEALLAVGSFAAQALTGREGMALGRLRGQVHAYRGVPLICTYHPAALLRNPRWTRAFWNDLQLLRSVMDGAAGPSPA
ncbi:MAG TPA: uracil-DNA glycosylase [Longimicrobiales bacterium]|nr:uracil-DNA glycosylase [Longimicrobiales bacterium]